MTDGDSFDLREGVSVFVICELLGSFHLHIHVPFEVFPSLADTFSVCSYSSSEENSEVLKA